MTPLVPFGDLRREARALREPLDEAVERVLGRGRFILDDEAAAFEREFAVAIGVRFAVGVNSGTDALTIALLALGIGPGDEVITVANTCVPTAFGILASGASLKIADCDPDTLMLTADAVKPLLTKRTRAVVPVHLYGSAADAEGLRDLAHRHGAVLVEDCAQAVDTVLTAGHAGSFGDAGAFSFYPSKNLGAYGDGGCVITSDAAVADRARVLRNHGQDIRDTASTYGLNSRLDEMQAAILRAKMPYRESWAARRRSIAKQYRASAQGRVEVPRTPAHVKRHGEHVFPILVDDRDVARKRLKARGIATLVHYPTPLHLQPALTNLGYRKGDFPAAERACARVLSLPLFPFLSDAEVEIVCGALREA